MLADGDFPVEFGRYTLLGLLGEGGMARVFRAELLGPEGFRKPAAVKIVRSAIASDNERLRVSLINEARLGGLLHHPNVVDTYDFGDVDGLPYIAMEYVRGIGLEKALGIVQPLPAPIACEIGIQVCAGLDHAHNLEDAEGASELVHRDLKPSNVILSRDGLAKVMDFGIAKATALSATNTATGMTKGTPSYMSPEQVNGEELDRRSDIFAMGAILYELFTGKRLFVADSLMSILVAVLQVEDRLASSRALDELDLVTLGLSDVVRRCLRRDRADRYADAAALEDDLKALARQLEAPPPLKRWVRDLMATGGMGAGEDSVSLTPPARGVSTLRTGPHARPGTASTGGAPRGPAQARTGGAVAPSTQPADATGDAASARASGKVQAGLAPSGLAPAVPQGATQVPPTRMQQPAGVPEAPAARRDRAAGGGTLWVEEGERRPRRRRGPAPAALIALGLVAGGALAAAAITLAVLFLREPPPPAATPPAGDASTTADEDGAAAAAALKGSRVPAPGSDGPGTESTPARRTSVPPQPSGTAPPTTDPGDTRPAPSPGTGDPPHVPSPAASGQTPAPLEPTPGPAEATPQAPEVTPRAPSPTPRTTDSTPRPQPTAAEPTPASGRSDRERLAEERRRELLGDRTATATAEPVYDGPPRLHRPRVHVLDRGEDGIKVRFQVEIQGQCGAPAVTLHYNPPGAGWLTSSMMSKGEGPFLVNLTFKDRNQGKVAYWIEATCGGQPFSSGTEQRPLQAEIE